MKEEKKKTLEYNNDACAVFNTRSQVSDISLWILLTTHFISSIKLLHVFGLSITPPSISIQPVSSPSLLLVLQGTPPPTLPA